MDTQYLEKAEAERLAQIKLDGRRKYFLWDGIVCYDQKFTRPCSGCSSDYIFVDSAGLGCQECGYKGRRKSSFPCPANPRQVRL